MCVFVKSDRELNNYNKWPTFVEVTDLNDCPFQKGKIMFTNLILLTSV